MMGIADYLPAWMLPNQPTQPGGMPPEGGAPVAPAGGFGDMLNKALMQNTNMLGMTGLGLLTARTAEQQRQALMNGYLYGSGMDAANRKEKKEDEEKRQKQQSVAKAKAALAARFPEYAGALEAVNDPEGLTRIISLAQSQSNADRSFGLSKEELELRRNADARAERRPVEVGGSLVAPQPDGTYKPVYEAPRVPKENWVRLGDTAVETNSGRTIAGPAKTAEGEKLSSGYRWIDPNNTKLGQEPIPGGPGEANSADNGGRIGLAIKSVQKDLPEIYRKVEDGVFDSAAGRASLATDTGEAAQLRLKLKSSLDALVRLQTGAAMTKAEEDQYNKRYIPSPTEGIERQKAKIRQLYEDLDAAVKGAKQGKGGFDAPALDAAVKDLRDNGAITGGAPTANPPGTAPKMMPQGKTSTGVPWTIAR
jgi:hypothetical protein